MQKILNNSVKNQYFLLGILIITVPFLEFIKSNFYLMNKSLFLNISIFFFILFFFYTLFYVFLKIKISIEEKRLKYILCFTWTYFGLYFNLKQFRIFLSITKIDRNSKNITAELSLIIIIILSFLFLFKNFTKIIIPFVIVFFIAQHLIIYFIIVRNLKLDNYDKKNDVKIYFQNKNFFSENEIKNITKKDQNKNIYYLMVENLTSFKEYENLGGKQNFKEWEKNFNDFGYTYIENTYSVYTNTADMIGSIFNLEPIFIDPSNYKKELRFPDVLSSFKFDEESKLTKSLKQINYNFYWTGNILYECKNYNEKICLNYNKENSLIDSIINKINFNTLSVFLHRTPIEEIYRKIYGYYKLKKNSETKKMKIGSIERFILEKNKKNKDNNFSNFYFIHDLGAKRDVIFNSNCDAIDYFPKEKKESNDIYKFIYLKSYECMIKRINKFIDFIEITDPNAIVIIQADHGERTLYNDPLNLKRYEIFNLIKIDENCKKNISNKIDNINSVRLALSCATSTSIKIIEKKSFFKKTLPNNKNILYEISLN